jgi:hypothetical protein
VVFARSLPESLADIILRGRLLDAERSVIVFVGRSGHVFLNSISNEYQLRNLTLPAIPPVNAYALILEAANVFGSLHAIARLSFPD